MHIYKQVETYNKACKMIVNLQEFFWGRITYGFEGVCIQSDTYHGDGSELLKADVCSSDILVNKNRITFKEIMKNPRYRKIIFGDE